MVAAGGRRAGAKGAAGGGSLPVQAVTPYVMGNIVHQCNVRHACMLKRYAHQMHLALNETPVCASRASNESRAGSSASSSTPLMHHLFLAAGHPAGGDAPPGAAVCSHLHTGGKPDPMEPTREQPGRVQPRPASMHALQGRTAAVHGKTSLGQAAHSHSTLILPNKASLSPLPCRPSVQVNEPLARELFSGRLAVRLPVLQKAGAGEGGGKLRSKRGKKAAAAAEEEAADDPIDLCDAAEVGWPVPQGQLWRRRCAATLRESAWVA